MGDEILYVGEGGVCGMLVVPSGGTEHRVCEALLSCVGLACVSLMRGAGEACSHNNTCALDLDCLPNVWGDLTCGGLSAPASHVPSSAVNRTRVRRSVFAASPWVLLTGVALVALEFALRLGWKRRAVSTGLL